MNRVTPRRVFHFLLAWFACVCVIALSLRLWSPEFLERTAPDGAPIPGADFRLIIVGVVICIMSAALAWMHARAK